MFYIIIMSMNHIIDNIYLGCFDGAENKNLLVNNNIKYIFNVAIECNNSINVVNDLTIFAHKYNIYDDNDITIDILNDIFNKLVNIESNDGNVLIHCAHGRSRSVCIVLYYLMKKCNFTLDNALNFVKNARPCITPSLNYIKLLSTLDNNFDIDSYYISSIKSILKTNLSDNQIKNIVYNNKYDLNSIINNLI